MRWHYNDDLMRLTRLLLSSILGGIALFAPHPIDAQAQDGLVVRAWGGGSHGQMGDGGDADRHLPVPVRALGYIRAIAAGWGHNLALKADGTVWAWGSNEQCQAGSKSALYLTLPTKIAGLTDVRAVATGSGFSLALKSDGTVWAWGSNRFGQLGNGTTTSRSFAQSRLLSRQHRSGPDGNPEPAQVKGLTAVVAVAAGSDHSLALKADGTVWAWGHNTWGQLGTGARTSARPGPNSAGVAVGSAKAIALAQAEWPDSNLPVPVEGIDQVTTIAAGPDTSYAIRKDGTLWNWGVTSRKPSDFGSYTCSATPIQIKALSHVIAVAQGEEHTLALTAEGKVWSWGSNNWGELGNGTLEKRESPAVIPTLNRIVAIAAGYGHSAALQSDGTVWTWGYNAFGQSGDGTQSNHQSPIAVKALKQVVAISAGATHCLALVPSGTPDSSAAAAAGTRVVTAAGADANGAVGYNTYYEVDPYHWSQQAITELRKNDVIPPYNDRYENLIKRRQFALNIQRGLDYSVFLRPGPTGAHFPSADPQLYGHERRGGRKTLWPEEAQLLLRLLGEYRADVLALWRQQKRDPGELNGAEQRLIRLSRETPPLATPVTDLHMTNAAVEDVYMALVQRYHLSLSLLETSANIRVSIDVRTGTVRDVLDQITAHAPSYRLRQVNGRLILMPDEARYKTVVTEPNFVNVPRLEAQTRYCDYLRKHVAGFADLSAPVIIIGNAHAPILAEPITLHGRTTVLERFVQLLGTDSRACFYIHRHLKNLRGDNSLFYIMQAPRAVETVEQ